MQTEEMMLCYLIKVRVPVEGRGACAMGDYLKKAATAIVSLFTSPTGPNEHVLEASIIKTERYSNEGHKFEELRGRRTLYSKEGHATHGEPYNDNTSPYVIDMAVNENEQPVAYLCEYVFDGSSWSIELVASTEEEAQAKLAAIKQTAIIKGAIYER